MDKRHEQVISLTQELVRLRSYSGEEGDVSEAVKRYMEGHGFDSVTVDGYGNTIGCIKGNRPGRKILFDGHMDTVPVQDQSEWIYPPFAAEIHDERIYGRGTTDMKGALAAMICAAADFAEDTGRDFAGEIYVAGIVHEECFEGVASRSVSSIVKPDVVVIGEASGLDIKTGQRGRPSPLGLPPVLAKLTQYCCMSSPTFAS